MWGVRHHRAVGVLGIVSVLVSKGSRWTLIVPLIEGRVPVFALMIAGDHVAAGMSTIDSLLKSSGGTEGHLSEPDEPNASDAEILEALPRRPACSGSSPSCSASQQPPSTSSSLLGGLTIWATPVLPGALLSGRRVRAVLGILTGVLL